MNVTVIERPRMTIQAFAEEHALEMVVEERPLWAQRQGIPRYHAAFRRAETREGEHVLCGTYGNGATPAKAIAAYADAISEQTLVVDAYGADRRVIVVPILTLDAPDDEAGGDDGE